ncbi:MAG: hypothetical protein U0031_00010 [Thermomicrobiales bacterium]
MTTVIAPNGNTVAGFMSFQAGGHVAVDAHAVRFEDDGEMQASATYLITGLTPGSNVFTAKYRLGNAGINTSVTFSERNIIVIPLP